MGCLGARIVDCHRESALNIKTGVIGQVFYGSKLEVRARMVWDGKERRKSRAREELRERMLKLQREFETAHTLGPKPPKTAPRKRNKPASR